MIFLSMINLINWTFNANTGQDVNLFPNLEESFDFDGRHLTVVANNGGAFVHLVEQPDGSQKVIGGIDVEICNILAKKHNFS